MYFKNYFIILLFILIGILIVGVLPQLIGYIFAPHKLNKQKNLPYECGFDSFGNARIKFNIHYYLIAILFILFDIETVYFFSWGISMRNLGLPGYITIMTFITEFIIAFIYIFKKKALDWN